MRRLVTANSSLLTWRMPNEKPGPKNINSTVVDIFAPRIIQIFRHANKICVNGAVKNLCVMNQVLVMCMVG